MLIYQRVLFGSSCQSELHCHVAFQYDLPERAQHFDLRPCFYRAEPPSKMSTKSWGLKKHIQSHPTIYYLYWLSGYQNGHLGYPPFLVTLISTCLGFSSHQILLSRKPHRAQLKGPPLHRHKLCCTHPPPTNQWPAKSRHTGYTSPGFNKACGSQKYGWGTRGLVVTSQEVFGSITKIVAGVSDMLLIIWSLWLWHWMKLVRVTTMDQVHETNGFLSGEAGSKWFRTWLCLTFWKTAFTSRKTREKPRQTHESSTIQPPKRHPLAAFPSFPRLRSRMLRMQRTRRCHGVPGLWSSCTFASARLGVAWKTQRITQILVICHQSLPYCFLILNFIHRIGIVNINSGAIQILPAEPIWFAHAHIIYHFCHGLAVLSSKSIGIPSIYLSIIFDHWFHDVAFFPQYPILNQNLRYYVIFYSIVLHHYINICICHPLKQYV